MARTENHPNDDALPRRDRYRFATRINSFRRDGRPVAEAICAAAAVPGLSALELNYPQHVLALGEGNLAAILDDTGLVLTGLNLRFEGERFANGAFTAPDPRARADAVATAVAAVDLAASFGADHVVLWMADDGWDYPLQVDYDRLWRHEIDGFRAVAAHRPGIRVSVEYKPTDPRRVSLVRSMGEALLAAREVALANFGVTIDVCHALMAGESPAAAASMALREGRLFGVHLNDGYGAADDGLAAGSVRPAELLDLLLALRRGGYAGTLYFDTFPVREDPLAECAANIATIRRLEDTIDRLDMLELDRLRAAHDALGVRTLLRGVLDEC